MKKILLLLTTLTLSTSCSTIKGYFSSDEDKDIDNLSRELDKYHEKTMKDLKAKRADDKKRSSFGSVVELPTLRQ